MTFSVVGRTGDAFGVAVASKFLAVGSVVPAARLGVGAVATQALAKVSYKEDALRLLADGADADEAVRRVTGRDDKAAHRQLGVVATGSAATWTGPECLSWAGGLCGGDDDSRFAIQGNILAGPQVVQEMLRAWRAAEGQPLPRRLLATLLAGDAAGGDSRGRQAAALYAVQPGTGYDGGGVLADLRVDDHPQAPTELERLLEENELVFGTAQDVVPLVGELRQEVRSRLALLGHPDEDVHAALAAWASVRNVEMRLSGDGIDPLVLAALRTQSDNASGSAAVSGTAAG